MHSAEIVQPSLGLAVHIGPPSYEGHGDLG
jgi:hypothetical protein